MYDWANSAFATSAAVAIVPVYFVSLFKAALGDDVQIGPFNITGSSLWAFAVAFSALAVAIIGPVLGRLADREGKTQRFLFIFTSIGSIFTFLCFYTSVGGGWIWLITCFTVASFGFSGSGIFYNALMTSVADKSDYDHVSSVGYAYGYLGGGILLIIHFAAIFISQDSPSEDFIIRLSIASVGIWWFVWSLWTLWKIPETTPKKKEKNGQAGGFASLKQIMIIPGLFPFLLAFFLFNEGIQTVLSVSGAYGADVLGISLVVNMALIVIVQLVAAPGSIFFGWLAGIFGARNSLLVTLIGWIFVVLLALSFSPLAPDSEEDFDVLLVTEGSGAYMVEMEKGEQIFVDYVISETPMILSNGNKIIEGDVVYLLDEVNGVERFGFSVLVIGGKLDGKFAIGGDHPSSLNGGYLEKWALIVRNTLWSPLGLDVTYQWIFLGVFVGIFMGGSQALARSHFASLIPSDKSGEFFGYFATVGRISTVLGPLLYFLAVGALNQRFGVFVILMLIIVGTVLLKWPVSLSHNSNEK